MMTMKHVMAPGLNIAGKAGQSNRRYLKQYSRKSLFHEEGAVDPDELIGGSN